MLKILIADDEKAIRESISQCINWEELGLNLMGVYKNGIEAFDAVVNEVPDIIMTDIRMPGMNGLELIERVTRINPDTQFIVLSGYGEFAYAQTAMQFGVRHYLLKPCSEEQIITSLKEVIEKCCQKRAIHHMTDRQKEIIYSLRQSVFMNILSEAAFRMEMDNQVIYAPYMKLIDFEGPRYILVRFGGLKDLNIQSCYTRIRDFHQKYAPSIPIHAIYIREDLLFFFQEYSLENSLNYSLCQHFADNLKMEGIIEDWDSIRLSNLSDLMDRVLDTVRKNGSVSYVTADQILPIYSYNSIWGSVTESCLTLCNLYDDFSAAAEKKREECMEVIQRQLYSGDNCGFLVQLTSHILFSLADHDCYCSLIQATEMLTELKQYTNPDLLRNDFIEWMTEMVQKGPEQGLQGKLIQDIKDYIDANLSDPDLTLKKISENYLYMNVDYVSKRFFKETGTKFSMYLREVRIQRAKELIASGDANKLQNIAQYVGLGNSPQYFSQVFKKHTGMTPTAYSRMMHGKN